LLILAGAGSGKTRVITHRIAHIIHDRKTPPWSIFAVTFTNKAAEEMRNRVITLTGADGNSVFIKTFHSASVYILRRYGSRIGIEQNFSIYDQGDQEQVIKELLVRMRLDPKKIKPSSIASKISEIKDRADLVEGARLDLLMPDYHAFDFSALYREYHEQLRLNNALDFNDLIIKTVELLRGEAATLQELQRRWRYFMIDEYQDTNHAQYLMARYLASASRNLCVVGDDDQSIYSWRGADIRNILDFEKDYDDARVITLEENYRSRSPILESASHLIRNNVNRKEKNLRSSKGDGEPVVWCRANNEYGEAEYVVSMVQTLKSREGFKNRDFALFYRTNAQSRVFEDILRRNNVPYRVVGGLKFYDRREIKDMLAYLKFIANPHDAISLKRIINTPSRGVGAATVEKIRDAALREGMSEWDIITQGMLKGKVPRGVEEFRDIVGKARMTLQGVPQAVRLSDFVLDIFNSSGYRKSLEEENSIESASRIENVEEFINSVHNFESVNPEGSLAEFLQEISLFTSEEDPGNPDERDNALTMMTVHNAKGLEFPVVFLTGMEENTFPHRFSIDTEEGVEEERRLCYVGITRAMERVFLTNAELRRTYAGADYREPSRFIFELPRHCLETRRYNGDSISGTPARSERSWQVRDYGGMDREKKAGGAGEASAPVRVEQSGSGFRKLEKVLHPRYGIGTVIGIEGAGDNVKLTIVFSSGAKTFLEKYTPLERAT
jgi:DNA helicase-2/ATP-dependent DNA helicase PcrA